MLRCAITDGTASTRAAWLLARAATLAAGGLDLLIVRETALGDDALLAFTRRLVAAAPATRVLVAAGRADIALAAGAAGVHLPAHCPAAAPAQIRRLFPTAFLTQSCHTLAEVRTARDSGVDAALFGPVFGKVVEGRQVLPGIGLPALAQACSLGLPILALGGITQASTQSCLDAGAAGVAAIRLFFPPS